MRAKEMVFLNRLGGVIRRSNFANRNWKPRLRRLGLTVCGFHTARHTAASIALSNGLPVTKAAAWLGDRVDTLLRTYAHWIDQDHSEAANMMQQFYEKKSD
ncbi:site-specific integrase [Thalassoglobus neptunius]|uniref:hypothetical protein n=1 Tax=Thalassoglobus neptunius TaxID=1938619 RepID=UPI0011B5B8EF|nr:hypothetical protein [Thalassoglobus neptunius]